MNRRAIRILANPANPKLKLDDALAITAIFDFDYLLVLDNGSVPILIPARNREREKHRFQDVSSENHRWDGWLVGVCGCHDRNRGRDQDCCPRTLDRTFRCFAKRASPGDVLDMLLPLFQARFVNDER